MDHRQRIPLGVLWLVVGGLAIVATGEPTANLRTAAGAIAAFLALWLAVLYLANPWGLLEKLPQ